MSKCCSKSDFRTSFKTARGISYLSTFLVILIPKCPFCIMAYTSAITVCGGQDVYLSQENWVSYIPLLLALLILFLLAFNRKGVRTLYALVIVMTGFIFLVLTHQLILPPSFYNIGAGMLLAGIWVNGSFLSFMLHLKKAASAIYMGFVPKRYP